MNQKMHQSCSSIMKSVFLVILELILHIEQIFILINIQYIKDGNRENQYLNLCLIFLQSSTYQDIFFTTFISGRDSLLFHPEKKLILKKLLVEIWRSSFLLPLFFHNGFRDLLHIRVSLFLAFLWLWHIAKQKSLHLPPSPPQPLPPPHVAVTY